MQNAKSTIYPYDTYNDCWPHAEPQTSFSNGISYGRAAKRACFTFISQENIQPSLASLFCACQGAANPESIESDFYSLYLEPEVDFNSKEIRDIFQRVLHWLDNLKERPGRAGTVARQCKQLVEKCVFLTEE